MSATIFTFDGRDVLLLRKRKTESQVRWHTLAIPALRRLRKENYNLMSAWVTLQDPVSNEQNKANYL